MNLEFRTILSNDATERDFVSIPREAAVYCLNCDCYSVALTHGRCGVCHSEAVVRAAEAFESSTAAAAPHHAAFTDSPLLAASQ